MRTSTRSLAVIATSLGLAAAPGTAVAHGTHHHRHHHHHAARPAVVPAAVFLPKAASANEFEIVTGNLAQKSQSAAIRALGAMFVTDHTAALQQGAQVAAQLGISAPPQLNRHQQAIADRLARLSGRAFDAAWLRAQLAAHQQALALHLAAAIRGENDAIRMLAQGALPMITKHLGELIDIAEGSGARAHR
jgi:putative membrane protein